MLLHEGDYTEVCPECEGWDIRITETKDAEKDNELEILVKCHECGFEWVDFMDKKEETK